ncbi:hypothetical protein LPW11_14035 [Geomonas sp. RF6]|uniref:hypothetical protein n=1 Tax=Geomonas sp. RF6 TaxID=2897342 RepID=UPI001E642110|nr:hypothetical protein [Geomonas sp. RF6]UFS69012.1 hypothetical protein LPW11_14035 [Geomonas sp. RF6]
MSLFRFSIGALFSLLIAAPVQAGDDSHGTIFTLWPLVDYRESPAEGYRNLSILGPFLKFQIKGDERVDAVRPFFYRTEDVKEESSSTTYLYPVAASDNSREAESFEVLRLYQKTTYRKDEGKAREEGTTLFPFYISGRSDKYGPYRAVAPFYGDMYERFWRDEYHFVMFPLYGQTVKKGTTRTHYLWPIFSRTEGENESGFGVFPLYGQEAKEGVYHKKYVMWPFYLEGESGLDTDNPTTKKFYFPFYAATDSPQKTSRSYLWPFFGYTDDRAKKYHETDYFYPFIRTVRGEGRDSDVFLPFYAKITTGERQTHWYGWPFYRHEEWRSNIFNRDEDRVLYFLYRSSTESWPKDGSSRERSALWPLYLYTRTPQGVSSFSFPAPVESILDREGIERNWAPLWRIYQRKWDGNGHSASSFMWNLFWHERRGEDLAYEVFPLIRYNSEKSGKDLKLLKGVVRYKSNGPEREFSLFWLPGVKWGAK